MKKFLLAVMIIITHFACKKDKTIQEPAPAAIDGYWTGKFTETGDPAKYDLAVVLRNNGTVRILFGFVGDTSSAAYKTEDNYSYSNGTLQFQSRVSSYIYSYKGSAAGTSMSGTWGELPSFDDGGTWTLEKAN